MVAAALGAAILAGCSERAPNAILTVTPAREIAPFRVLLDASASSSPKMPAPMLEARFDFDGDGAFDTDFSHELTAELTYETPGHYTPRVEVREPEGASSIAASVLELAEDRRPVADLKVNAPSGPLPLNVILDASGSSDADEPNDVLEMRFDLDGDGTFDTPFSSARTATYTFFHAGRYAVTVEVRDARQLSATARATVTVTANANLAADTDRDGVVTDLDDEDEDKWSAERGAVFLANLDDDDGDGQRDSNDRYVSGAEDLADLAPLVIRRYPDLVPESDTVTLSVSPAAAREVRIFLEGRDLNITEVYAPGGGPARIPPGLVGEGDTRLFIEGVHGRSPSWNGAVVLTLAIEHGGVRQEDAVAMRCAPIIFPDNTLAPRILHVMRIDDFQLGPNLPFFNAIESNLPDDVMLYAVDQFRYGADRWVQDNMQTGYQALPVEGGTHTMKTYLETERQTGSQGLEYLVTNELLRSDLGYAYPGGRPTSLNYGGNLEVTPTHSVQGADYPFGRIMIGGGATGTLNGLAYEDHMAMQQKAFLESQGPQAPAIELSTEWLAVGHLDEIFQFVPDVTSRGGRPWKIVLASPRLARSALEELASAGLGRSPVFQGRETQTTVTAILSDAPLMATNQAAQVRIDLVRSALSSAMELTDEDFVEVPVLYEAFFFDGLDSAAAYSPGMQNLVTAGTTMWVPDPEGPDRDGADVWQQMAREALEPLGFTVHFVDIFESYHLNLGEAHCGVELERAPHDARWWEHE